MNLKSQKFGASSFTGLKHQQILLDTLWNQAEKFDSISFCHGTVTTAWFTPSWTAQPVTAECPPYQPANSSFFKELNRCITSWYWIPV